MELPTEAPFGNDFVTTFPIPRPGISGIDSEALAFLRGSFASFDTVLSDGTCVGDWCFDALVANFEQILMLRGNIE